MVTARYISQPSTVAGGKKRTLIEADRHAPDTLVRLRCLCPAPAFAGLRKSIEDFAIGYTADCSHV